LYGTELDSLIFFSRERNKHFQELTLSLSYFPVVFKGTPGKASLQELGILKIIFFAAKKAIPAFAAAGGGREMKRALQHLLSILLAQKKASRMLPSPPPLPTVTSSHVFTCAIFGPLEKLSAFPFKNLKKLKGKSQFSKRSFGICCRAIV